MAVPVLSSADQQINLVYSQLCSHIAKRETMDWTQRYLQPGHTHKELFKKRTQLIINPIASTLMWSTPVSLLVYWNHQVPSSYELGHRS